MWGIRIDVYHHFNDEKLDEILKILKDVQRKEEAMGEELDALTAQVTANESLEQSAITLIEGIAAQLTGAKEDPAKVQALSDSLKTSAAALSAAIAANTPAPAAPAGTGAAPGAAQ